MSGKPSGSIGVTGATGRLGARGARLLAADRCPQRLLVRNPTAAPNLSGSEVVGIPGYADGPACCEALRGVETLFMVSARESAHRCDERMTFVDAADQAGVGHVIYTSFYGAAADAVFTFARDHWATEEHIRASGLRWTFLRDCMYLDLIPLIGGPGRCHPGGRRATAGSPGSRSTMSPGWLKPFSSLQRITPIKRMTRPARRS